MKSITVKAEAQALETVLSFVTDFLEENEASVKLQMQFSIAVEEIFVNIYSYAYPDGGGDVRINAALVSGNIELSFADKGLKYNPLEHENPDISLGIDERAIGGLGIFMVKKSMDSVLYQYSNGENILTLIKQLV